MIGTTISHYRILEKLGEGGMGVVYKAHDTKLDRDVAIKFLPHQVVAREQQRERFVIEAQAAAALNHPNIATIYAIEEADGETFIVMEHIEGQELKGKIAQGPLAIDEAVTIATQIAEGLQAAHKKDIVHRDIKSSNIMLTESGQVKIMDFGLAKVRGGLQVTREGTTVGTTAYMSPEQARGDEVDHRTDIWSFGVVLYEMLTGSLPFRSEYDQAVIYSILNEVPERMADVSPEMEQIVMRALAKNPGERYHSAADIARDLREIGDQRSGRIKVVMKKDKTPWLVGAAVVLLTAVAVYLFMPSAKHIQGKAVVKTIAVLPFDDLSPKKDQGYFSDGLSEELINVLSKNPKLRVTAKTSSFSFKGTHTNIKTIAQTLIVKNILEGSVRKAGNNLRISADLVNVETDATLWSNTYDGTLDNIFALQDSISGSVAEALKAALLGIEAAVPEQKTDPEAYNDYLLGNHFFDLAGEENWEKAEGYYEKALSIDSSYAPVWVGLSQTHTRQADWGFVPVDVGYRKARQEVKKALKLNPNFAEAYSQMEQIKMAYDWDWDAANELLKRGLELEPGNADLINNAARLAFALGRFNEAITLDRRSTEINPVGVKAHFYLGMATYYAGLFDESMMALRKCLELNPQFPLAHTMIGRIYLARGKPDSALVVIKREQESTWHEFGLALVYHTLGKKKEADEVLAAYIKERQNYAAYQTAEIYAYRNEKDKAFKWLERAYNQRDGGLSQMVGDPLLRNIVKDPRYAVLMEKMKLPL
jgi:serine/threonine protein kinase/Flp pilus assembly protein TadD